MKCLQNILIVTNLNESVNGGESSLIMPHAACSSVLCSTDNIWLCKLMFRVSQSWMQEEVSDQNVPTRAQVNKLKGPQK